MNLPENTSLLVRPVSGFLDALAERTPTPGGGAVAGLAGALSAALARMVAAYSVGKKTPEAARSAVADLAGQIERAEAMLRRFVDEDAAAYAAYTEASKISDQNPAGAEAKDEALALAMTVPLGIAATAGELLIALGQLAPLAGRYLLSDLEAAAILAEATVRCAGCSVRVNAAVDRNTTRAAQVLTEQSELEAHAQARLAAVAEALHTRIQPGE